MGRSPASVMRDGFEAQQTLAFGVALQRQQPEVDFEQGQVPPRIIGAIATLLSYAGGVSLPLALIAGGGACGATLALCVTIINLF
jgi:hypothetical protein